VAQELGRKPPPSGRQRVAEAAACGGVAGAVAAWFVPWQLTVLLAWDVAAAAVLLRAWLRLRHFDADDTRRWATREDDDPRGAEVMLVVSGSVSLVGVAFAFIEANSSGTSDAMGVILRVAGVLTIALSWGVIHTVFALRYARLYYAEPPGAIDFKADDYEPNYRDFAYFAFTVGMTYQVSDTDIHSHKIRRTVLRHALLSFFFGTVILATTVNLVANLLND
jgi:uncharacterized membrane protein